MMHILLVLTLGYAHRGWSACQLYHYYLHHRAVRFLLSGVTSETPHGRAQALALLRWLTWRHIAPVDW